MPQEIPQQPGSSDFALTARAQVPSLQNIASVTTLSAAQRTAFMKDVLTSQGAASGHAGCVNCEQDKPASLVFEDVPDAGGQFSPMPSQFAPELPQAPIAGQIQFTSARGLHLAQGEPSAFFLADGLPAFLGGPATQGVHDLCSRTLTQSGILPIPPAAGGFLMEPEIETAETPAGKYDYADLSKVGPGPHLVDDATRWPPPTPSIGGRCWGAVDETFKSTNFLAVIIPFEASLSFPPSIGQESKEIKL